MPQVRQLSESGNSSAIASRHAQQQDAAAAGGVMPSATNNASGRTNLGHSMPAWRRIEALKERRALKEALADIWSDDPDLGDEVFFSGDEQAEAYYCSAAENAELNESATTESDDEDL